MTSGFGRAGPRIAIGLPVYNGERYVARAIESLLAQTYPDFELVITDNASSDRTEEICREYARDDARIRYERNPVNLGAAPNFNHSFALATPSEYFKWMASDDLVSEDFLERCVEALDRDHSAAVAFPAAVYIDGDGSPIGKQAREDLSLLADRAADRARSLMAYALEGPDIYWAIYGLVRRSMLDRTELHGSYIASDQVLLLQLALLGKLVQVPDARFVRRAHPEAWTMRTDRTTALDALWFDASSRSRFLVPHWTLMRRHYRSISRGELSAGERVRCRLAVTHRALREWRNLGGDLKDVARETARRLGPGRRRTSTSV